MAKVGVTKGVRKVLALCNKNGRATKSAAGATKRKRATSSVQVAHSGHQTTLTAFMGTGKEKGKKKRKRKRKTVVVN